MTLNFLNNKRWLLIPLLFIVSFFYFDDALACSISIENTSDMFQNDRCTDNPPPGQYIVSFNGTWDVSGSANEGQGWTVLCIGNYDGSGTNCELIPYNNAGFFTGGIGEDCPNASCDFAEITVNAKKTVRLQASATAGLSVGGGVGGQQHMACNSDQACVLVDGPGDNLCPNGDPDCVPVVPPPGQGRFECSNNTCAWNVNGSGPNQCGTNSDCIAAGSGGNGGSPSHFECVNYTCTNVGGAGPDQCDTTPFSCGEPPPTIEIFCQVQGVSSTWQSGPCYLPEPGRDYSIYAVPTNFSSMYIQRDDNGASTASNPVTGSAMGPPITGITPVTYTAVAFSNSGATSVQASLQIIPPNPYLTVNVVTEGLSTGGWCLYSPSPNAPASPLCREGNYSNTIASPGSYQITPVPPDGYSVTVSPSSTQSGVAGGTITFTITYVLNACNVAGSPYSIDYFVVGGGGGGGSTYYGGGGGGGGVLIGTATITSGDSILVALGDGGLGAQSGANSTVANGGIDDPIYWQGQHGASSLLFGKGLAVTAIGGGGTGGYYGGVAQNGGSGGGGFGGAPYAFGTPGQGNRGGPSFVDFDENGNLRGFGGGGGGGAGDVGGLGYINGGIGGPGKIVPWLGNSFRYGAGGGGAQQPVYGTSGIGGLDGGGSAGLLGGDGSPNTGGGGGGSYAYGGAGGDGASGLVVIRYAGAPRGTWGDSVSQAGGYTLHVFNQVGGNMFNSDASSSCGVPTITEVTATEPNYCLSGPAATIGWTYSDSGGSPQSAYQVQITETDNFSSPVLDTGKINSSSNSYFTGQGVLEFNKTYKARVMVWNNLDASSSWTTMTVCNPYPGQTSGCQSGNTSWKAPLHAYPDLNGSNRFTWFPLNPVVGSVVQFTGNTVFAPTSVGRTWSWIFTGGNPTNSNVQNPANVSFASAGSWPVTLTNTDDVGTCQLTQNVVTQGSIPRWREVAPR